MYRGPVHSSSGAKRQIAAHGTAVEIPPQYSKITPRGPQILVKQAAEELQTPKGVYLPASAQRRPTYGKVVALGDGLKVAGKVLPFQVKEGDTVLYSKFGFTFTELKFKDEAYILVLESELLGTLPQDEPTADDIVDLQPVGDRIFVKVTETANVTSGGVIVPDSAKDKPLSGEVVRTGSGKIGEDGNTAPAKVVEGDRVLYFKYAGDNMETIEGEKFVVLRQQDILCKA